MPRLGYIAKDEKEFFARLSHLMDLAKDSLEIKRKIVQRHLDGDLLPYTKTYLGTLQNHFSTIGLVGMNEACLNFLGCSIFDPEGNDFASRVLDFMRDKIADFQSETGHIYNTDDLFEALDLQEPLQKKYTGGTVFHAFIGERIEDAAQVASLVKRIAETYKIPYFTLTPSFSICPVHGYIPGEHHECPLEAAEGEGLKVVG